MAAATTSAITFTTKIPKTPSNTHLFTNLIIIPTTKPFKPLKLKLHHNNSHHTPPSTTLSLLRASSSYRESETDPFHDSEIEQEGLEENFNNDENDDDDNSERELGRLYVGNLPYAMASAQLSEFFVEAGRVVSVEIVYDRVTDRSRGFAFVTMGSMKEAREAIRMFDGSQIGGRTVKVNFPEVPRGGEREVMGPKIRSSNQSFVDSPHKIYAGNLGWALNSQGLRDAFSDQPGLLSAKVVYDRATGRSRGFGFITFSSAEAMESALNTMNEVELEGRPLRLNKAEQRSPSTPLPQGGRESNFQSGEVLSSF